MDVDFITCDVSEGEALDFDENHDNSAFDGERCGICMDIIIDRGVLDCCEHWFCFGCIDDWATVMNLCPLCQSEFQSITCVPVYDTIGNNTFDEASFSGEDDWSIEGNSNTLSFPSYYIDENAVTCLDGDGCQIRSGLATIEDDSSLDTSIACDSCDIWYHAVCVGFDPEATSEDTWLCPRCSITDATSVQSQNNQCHAEISLSNKADFLGKVSVSVVDAGETAVVVSMVEPEEQRENFHSAIEANMDFIVDGVKSDDVNLVAETTGRSYLYQNMEAGGLDLSFSSNAFSSPFSDSLMLSHADETTNGASSSSRVENLPRKLCDKSSEIKILSGSESGMGLHLGLSTGSFLPGVSIPADVEEEDIKLAGIKRKHPESSDKTLQIGDGEANSENEAPALKKKIREREKFQILMSDDQIDAVLPNNLHECPTPVAVAKVVNFKQSLKTEDAISDIMSIVRGTDCKPSTGHGDGRPLKSTKGKSNKGGLRVKKIMRIAGEDKESSVVVQKLRKEIRDAVRNKSSTENLFDPKLLNAFRAAIAGSITEPVKKLPPGALKMKKSLMQKGKVRENLTKKIYGDSNGRRRRAWDRDCEVEFWKYRCTRATKPEKVATLNSVLKLLRKHPEGSEKEDMSKCQERNPLLSRLYLADTSVFPRKDDIMPLSALAATTSSQQNATPLISVGESQKPSSADHSLKVPLGNKVPPNLGITSVDGIGLKDKVPCSKGKNAPSKTHSQGGIKGSFVAPLGSKSNSPNEKVNKTDSRKIDKRKWALEVLARKKAVGSTSTAHEREEDDSVLKGNFPLLGQLPKDMRTEPAAGRHNKIPMSVRQKQLYRLTEHLLRKLDLPEMRRMAETELAVADATNIEEEVANRSNSRQGYSNLISHEILRRSDGSKSLKAQEPCSEAQSVIPDTSEPACAELSSDPEVLDALRNAGLLSDSPPNSPHAVPAEVNESNMQIEGPTNVFEMDSIDEADIYGDFEYDLDDEDYINASTVKVSKQPLEEGESKVKVVLTTIKSERLKGVEDYEYHQSFEDKEKHNNSAPLSKSDNNNVGISGLTTVISNSFVTLDYLPGEEGEDPSLAECEELYGPDKEPLINKLPEEMPHRQADTEASIENDKCERKEDFVRSNTDGKIVIPISHDTRDGDNTTNHSQPMEIEEKPGNEISKQCDASSVSKKVEAYIKEHIRPLCKSGIITAEQYRWAVLKTTDKVMKYHLNAKNANFLIKEGEKVKKLAEQYVEAAQQKGEKIMTSSLN